MDENSFIERIRADADQVDTAGSDVDTLVRNALQQGRRRRTRRRVASGAAGLVAAGLLVAALAGGIPATLDTRPGVVPATPASHQTASRTAVSKASSTPSPPATLDRVSGSPTQVRKNLNNLLPSSLDVTNASAAREEGSDGFAWEHNAALTVRGADGTSYIFGGIGDGHYTDGCYNLPDCITTELPDGGTLWVTRSPAGDKNGDDRTYRYNRPAGGHIWLTQRNYAGGNGPITRNRLPLSDSTARTLVTSPTWDVLFKG